MNQPISAKELSVIRGVSIVFLVLALVFGLLGLGILMGLIWVPVSSGIYTIAAFALAAVMGVAGKTVSHVPELLLD